MASSGKLLEVIDKTLVRLTTVRRNMLAEKADKMERRLNGILVGYGGVESIVVNRYGSFELDTAVNPFDPDKAYDVDLGVILLPATALEFGPKAYLSKVYDRLCEDFDDVEHRRYCIRANYATADETPAYNVDCSLYKVTGTEKHIAVKSGDWQLSDPMQFLHWFGRQSEQKPHLKKIVRLLKWWAQSYWTEMPSGLVISILSANSYSHDEQLDNCLYKTVQRISEIFSLQPQCLRPTTPAGENLLASASQNFTKLIATRFEKLSHQIIDALETEDTQSTIDLWNKIFDDHIPDSMINLLKESVEADLGRMNGGFVMGKGGVILGSARSDVANVPPTKFYGES